MTIIAQYTELASTVRAQIGAVVYFVPKSAIDNRDGEIPTIIAKWIDDGGVIAPYEPPPLTADDYAAAIQSHVDATAKARGYADGVALAGYATSAVTAWASEAVAFVAWRDAVWLYAYAELAKVQAAQRAVPTIDGLIAELPAVAWP